jgi:ribosomal protein S12 methylthiotransferase accessory factor
LVDVDSGIIAAIRRGAGLPADIPVWFAGPNRALSTADPSGLVWRWPGQAMGKGLTDAESRLSALAEAAERWSGTWQPSDVTANQTGVSLMESGSRVEPFAAGAALFSDAMELAQPWVLADDLTGGGSVWVPAAQVLIGHPPVEGRVLHTDANGLAAGVTFADAQLQALLEVIEREAIHLWWHNETRSEHLYLPDDGAVQPFLSWLQWLGIVVDLRRLPSLPGTTTLVALGWLPDTGRAVYGAGAHLDPQIAYRRTLLELVQSAAASLVTSRELSPWAGFDPSECRDAARQPGPRGTLESESASRARPRHSSDGIWVPVGGISGAAAELAGLLGSQGRRVVSVDVTRAEVGVPVARVIVAGQRSMPSSLR